MIEKITLISILSSLLTEALKNILNEMNVKYSSNALAAGSSIIITIAIQIMAIVYVDNLVTKQFIAESCSLIFVSFLGATLGYDKVMQMIGQVRKNYEKDF